MGIFDYALALWEQQASVVATRVPLTTWLTSQRFRVSSLHTVFILAAHSSRHLPWDWPLLATFLMVKQITVCNSENATLE